jgi:hypothetical protein
MNIYLRTFIKSIYSPLGVFSELSHSDKSVKYGWITTISFIVMYTVTAVIPAAKGCIY